MKVVHIAFQYGQCNTGGAAIAATRLHNALLARGVESHYICVYKREPGVNVRELPRGGRRRLFLLLTKITRNFWRLTRYRRSVYLNIIPMFGLEAELKKINPDVVHVQWINADVCSFRQLARLPYKMVFNLHDLFLLLPEKAYPDEDCRYIEGFRKGNSSYFERWMVERKRRLITAKAHSFIGPSDWVCRMCSKSIIGRVGSAFSIPNILDPVFETNVCETKNKKFIMLFGAVGGRRNAYKGFDDLRKALACMPKDMKKRCELHIFGEVAPDCVTEGVRTVMRGKISSSLEMLRTYQGADLFLFPSHQETQGMTKVEAMFCGLPVIAFDRSACAEGIEPDVTGSVVRNGDIAGYEKAIEFWFDKWACGKLVDLRYEIGACVRRRFQADDIVARVLEAYR